MFRKNGEVANISEEIIPNILDNKEEGDRDVLADLQDFVNVT